MRLQDVTVGIAWLAGVVGSLMVPAERRDRVALGLVAVGGTIALMLLRPLTSQGGVEVLMNHWGMVVVPSVLAMAPLAFSRVRGVRVDEPAVVATPEAEPAT
jgi:hypothetical protein